MESVNVMGKKLSAPDAFVGLVNLFQVGKKYTIFTINCMAITSKQEIQIVEYSLDDDFPVYKMKGKRTRYLLKLWSRSYQSAPLKPFEGAVFEGWDLPIKCDSDCYGTTGQVMRGNACYNFVGDLASIKALIETCQLNPFFDVPRSLCNGVNNDQEIPIFPDLYRGGCAPMDRYIEKMEK
jgi:hypothetical protein